ncbi:carbamoyltransferase [Dictyobacter alpinus]|uniref:Carbamoyltransferase n=1 Tax=Dictyobacter alpinus TaxID=2014873 RepID=A0A402BGK1_9CHLR|nr:carbamoyltransferase HypF [Dictyobacter alpinus]GCE30493.1 carbamoyltransferase [Dictyobacter alpinus]
MERERWCIHVQGIVQGVGFRPFVYALALRRRLSGFVLNNSQGVVIEVEGSTEVLQDFQHALQADLPPLAHIDTLQISHIANKQESSFVIVESERQAERNTLISPDSAICQDCLQELFDPQDRRFHYPFINCTNCGPRFTIIQDIPYDRANTTMAHFQMCPDCQQEYRDPLDRRFHAQPDACALCGPQIRFSTATAADSQDSIEQAAAQLARGAVLALKGLGGYHLACNALDERAVQRLRQRKRREAKPFALMVETLEVARQFCSISDDEAILLQSYRRPIVLLQQHSGLQVASDVAPGHNTLALMLPYTPLHYVLFEQCRRIFSTSQPVILVMTSGNLSDEPIAYRDEDARERLGPISDGILYHNREIFIRCDDSIVRHTTAGPQILRRARGYVPEPLTLPWPVPTPILACGAQLKNTFCMAKDQQAFVSHHIGDLENLETLRSFKEGIAHFQRLFDITPQVVVHDLHPDYLSTRYATELNLPAIGVQHHHAHIASVIIEHGLTEPVIGIAADGSGYGPDGAIWGGEILMADLCHFQRCFHLAYMPLPGGEQAIKQPWRMAAAYLCAAYGSDFEHIPLPFIQQLDHSTWKTLAQMIERKLHCPATSSLGRLCDAVAALIGLRSHVQYEGQAAIELEQLATTCPASSHPYAFDLLAQTGQIDVLPMIRTIVDDLLKHVPPAQIARRFHFTVAHLLTSTCVEVSKRSGVQKVALSGGIFQNRLILEELVQSLASQNFIVYLNHKVPTNDGGISLGQLAVAAAQLNEGKKMERDKEKIFPN